MQNQVFRYFSTFEKCDISRNSGARVAEGPVETLPGRDLMPLAFSESRFVYFVRIHDAHAHLDDTKIEACALTEYVLKSHKMVR